MERADQSDWFNLKSSLEIYGKQTGVFDEFRILRFGKTGIEPFQLQVRKHGGRVKGPWRNLIDVGYGVSQVLPLLIEFIRPESADLMLLQQPEVHLHPSAQAALGSIFCQMASQQKQIIVETHSDHLIDRVCMDIRDRKSALKPDEVSVLYFERDGQEVSMHSLEIDQEGNVRKAPANYRQFFIEEVNRSLGIG